MTYCENCCQLEGDTYESEDGETICKDCDEPTTKVREHDDGDER